MEKRILFIFILCSLYSLMQANDFFVLSNFFMLSSSPSGHYLLMEEKESSKLFTYNLRSKDTKSHSQVDVNSKFVGWKNDTIIYLLNTKNAILESYNVETKHSKLAKKIQPEALEIIRKSNFFVPSYFTDSLPFFVYVDISGIVYRYDFATSSKRQILNLTDFFSPKHTVNYFSIAPNGDLLFNIQDNNECGIFFYPLKGNGQVVPIDTTSKITPESYCFFFNIEKKCIFYRYHENGDNLSGIEVVEYDLSKMSQSSYENLPKGVVPSLAIDIPVERMFLINSIVVDSNYTVSLDHPAFSESSEIKEILFKMAREYIEKLINSFQVIPFHYNNFSIKTNFEPNTVSE